MIRQSQYTSVRLASYVRLSVTVRPEESTYTDCTLYADKCGLGSYFYVGERSLCQGVPPIGEVVLLYNIMVNLIWTSILKLADDKPSP